MERVTIEVPTDVPGYDFEITRYKDCTVFAYLVYPDKKKVSITGQLRSWLNQLAKEEKDGS